ncbi:MAG TPA: hypothetical protein ENH05_02945 [Rhizobiales bacterium]|nr:fixH [bacterium BMS3Bbin10]HDO51675.1 hypothetical protein [Hyphomicrobiales bacterium]
MSPVKFMPEKFEGRHVLFALIAFFGLMFLANGIFVYYALGTFNGNETTDAYRKGLNYNKRIAQDDAQTARGWKPAARYDAGAGRLVVEIQNRQGRNVAGLKISAEIRRPVNNTYDQSVSLAETQAARYIAPLDLAPGRWTLSAKVFGPGGEGKPAFRFRQRFWVKESP